MKGFQFAVLAVLVVFALSSPAQAQVAYASPTGTGTACSASAPCSLAEALIEAISPMAINGVAIACINGGVALVSTNTGNSFTFDCPGGVVSGAGAAAMTLTGTSEQVVKLRNLVFSGRGDASPPPPFIRVIGGATLIIENCRFEHDGAFGGGTGGPPIAIQFQPTSPAAQLIIRDSVFSNNGFAPGTGGALQVAPGAGGSASVLLERVSFNYNVTSMVLAGPVMSNSIVSSSRSNGILVGSGATLNIKDSMLVHNVGSAVSISSGGTLRLSNNDIEGNQVGISNSGGHALSYMNNRIIANGTDGTLTAIAGYTGGGK
jgi:hypothetical protein